MDIVFILKSTPIVATQFSLNLFSQNLKSTLVFPTPQSPIIISFRTYQSFFACILLQYKMQSRHQKKEKIIQQIRKKHKQQIRKNIRQQMVSQLSFQEQPLLSSTLGIFWELSHFELNQTSEKIMEVLFNTNFEELDDEEHYYLVTDLFYLIHQHIISEHFYVKFKKNEDPNTAALVAYLSSKLDSEEILYWVNFMDDDSKNLMYSMIEGQSEYHKMWVLNPQLFNILITSMKYSCEAALAFRQILTNSEELSKKQIDETVLYMHKAIIYAADEEKQYLRVILLSTWMRIILIYQKVKERNTKIQFMVTVLMKQLPRKLQIFLNLDILLDINALYQEVIYDYIGPQAPYTELAQYILSQLVNHPDHFEGKDPQYFLNVLFRLFYNIWRARNTMSLDYCYAPELMKLLGELSQWSRDNVWYIKLRKCSSC